MCHTTTTGGFTLNIACDVSRATHDWVIEVVVGLNLCPFAKRELDLDRVRIVVTDSKDTEGLLHALVAELLLLQQTSDIETTLLVHPDALQAFDAYNEFLVVCDEVLRALDMEGKFQIASFHPRYQFAGTELDAAENYSNRSPHPMLHILREESVTRAVDSYPGIERIPERNVARLNSLGSAMLERQLDGYRLQGS